MKLAILSDIHANLEALEAVLADAAKRLPKDRELVTLGDMVGYGADPEAVAKTLRGLAVRAVLGNHEVGVLNPGTRGMFNPVALEAVLWTADNISAETEAWLASLPKSLSLGPCRLVHGLPPDDTFRYLFEAGRPELARLMSGLNEPISFVGHTHVLKLLSLDQDQHLHVRKLDQGEHRLDRRARHMVNAGAVGQPRDGDPRAKYLIFDQDDWTVEAVFVPYDNRRAAAKILSSGLPAVFADRLIRHEPSFS